MKVEVLRDNCIGCGFCEGNCPEVFELDDEGISTVITDNYDNVSKEILEETMNGCPTNAIKITK